MSTDFPATGLDNFTNPASTDPLDNPSHSDQHANNNDAIEALEAKVGVNSSAVTTSHDYKLSGVTGTDKAVSKTGTETLTNKTLTSPVITNKSSTGTDSGSETLTNKTLTSPVITTPDINGGTLAIDIVTEQTADTGITLDGVLLKDSQVTTDVINEKTGANGVTVDGLNIKDGKINQDGAVEFLSLSDGMLVQQQYTISSAVATGTTVMISDDSIPQNTEGDQYMTVSITPKDTTHILEIEIKAALSHGTSGTRVIGALFQDAVANAIAADEIFIVTGTTIDTLIIKHFMVAGTTSATTFKFRAGGTSGTTTFNGYSGARIFGAITKSIMSVKEYKL